MLTKLMYPLLTIKLVKIKNKMRMPRFSEDTLKSVHLFNPPRGGVRVEGCRTFFKILWPWPSDMTCRCFWWGCSAPSDHTCACQYVHFDLCVYANAVKSSSTSISWFANRIIIRGGWDYLKESGGYYSLLCRYPLAVPLEGVLIN